MEPGIIDSVVRALQEAPDAVYSTAVTPLKHEEVTMRARVKCILDQARSPAPALRPAAGQRGPARPEPGVTRS